MSFIPVCLVDHTKAAWHTGQITLGEPRITPLGPLVANYHASICFDLFRVRLRQVEFSKMSIWAFCSYRETFFKVPCLFLASVIWVRQFSGVFGIVGTAAYNNISLGLFLINHVAILLSPEMEKRKEQTGMGVGRLHWRGKREDFTTGIKSLVLLCCPYTAQSPRF